MSRYYSLWQSGRLSVLSICSLIIFFISPFVMASPYYQGPLVQASYACLHGDASSMKRIFTDAKKDKQVDMQATAAYWICKGKSEKALPWLDKLSNKGDGWASQMLAYHYLVNTPYKDGVSAISYLRRAALQGNAWAAREMGVIYLNGINGVPADSGKASYWAMYAENVKEIIPNTFYLAASYLHGWGVPKNPEKAKLLYTETMQILKEAAKSGDPYADMLFYKFYMTYSQDVGTPKNIKKADFWLRQAAAEGYPPAIAIMKTKPGVNNHE